MIVGIDEVGRGSWAGPLVVGAVILGGEEIKGLTDSKKLSAKQRQALSVEIRAKAKSIGLGWVSAASIDRIGLSRALTAATNNALKEITTEYNQIIIDGTVNFIDDPRVTTMKQADLLVPSVSAASIIAKVARDYYMSSIVHNEFPDFGFDRHVGYGTKLHQVGLEKFGPNYYHRLSFAPVKKALGIEDTIKKVSKVDDTAGRIAEKLAAEYLIGHGFKIIDQNWRTKFCEIDIVAQKDETIYFVEVKYRKSKNHGDGLSAVNPKKLNQMNFAARIWSHWHNSPAVDMKLAVVSMSGTPPIVDEFLEVT